MSLQTVIFLTTVKIINTLAMDITEEEVIVENYIEINTNFSTNPITNNETEKKVLKKKWKIILAVVISAIMYAFSIFVF